MFLYVFICFYMFLYVFICFYSFLYVFIFIYIFLKCLDHNQREIYYPIEEAKNEESRFLPPKCLNLSICGIELIDFSKLVYASNITYCITYRYVCVVTSLNSYLFYVILLYFKLYHICFDIFYCNFTLLANRYHMVNCLQSIARRLYISYI